MFDAEDYESPRTVRAPPLTQRGIQLAASLTTARSSFRKAEMFGKGGLTPGTRRRCKMDAIIATLYCEALLLFAVIVLAAINAKHDETVRAGDGLAGPAVSGAQHAF